MPTSFPGAPMHICLACQDLNEFFLKKTILEINCCSQEDELKSVSGNMEGGGAVGISRWVP